MNAKSMERLWVFLVPIIAHLLIGLAGAAIFLAWQLHPGRLLAIGAAVGVGVSLGILVQGIRTSPDRVLRRQEAVVYAAWYLLVGVIGAFAVIGFLKTPRAVPAGVDKALASAVFLLAGAFAALVLFRWRSRS